MVLSLRSETFFPKTLLQTSLHGSLARVALHALLELLIGKRNGMTFRFTRPIPRAGAGLSVPRGTWLYGREVGEYQNRMRFMLKGRSGEGTQVTHIFTQYMDKRTEIRMVKGLPKQWQNNG